MTRTEHRLSELFNQKRSVLSLWNIVAIVTAYLITTSLEETVVPLLDNRYWPEFGQRVNYRFKNKCTGDEYEIHFSRVYYRFVVWLFFIVLFGTLS